MERTNGFITREYYRIPYTTVYDMALFMLCVCTNSRYVAVATFLLTDEQCTSTDATLRTVYQWCPQWWPRFSMSDFSDTQIRAVKAVFPDSFVPQCKFHRLLAWTQKLGRVRNNTEMLKRLNAVVDATTEVQYEQALHALWSCDEWVSE